MEEWNAGILRVKAEIKYLNCKKLLSFNFVQDKLTHLSITPSLHYSNWGEAPKFLWRYNEYQTLILCAKIMQNEPVIVELLIY